MGEWKHNYRATCKNCGDIIFSTREGEFVRCSCGKAYIDEVTTKKAANLHQCRTSMETTLEMRIGHGEEFMKVNNHE